MRIANIQRKNATPAVAMKHDMGKTADRPQPIAVAKQPTKKKKTVKKRE